MNEVSEEKDPKIESFLMFFIGIVIDFILVVGIGLNDDWQFYLAMFLIGLILTIHTIKFKQLSDVFTKGKGLYLYDVNLTVLIVFSYYALPATYNSLISYWGYVEGHKIFLYTYPVLELVFELLTN